LEPLVDNSEYYLEEPALSFELEKKFVDSFYYYKENPNNKIKIKNYNIDANSFANALFNKIENSVINESESTLMIKPVNYVEKLDYILKCKKINNELMESNLDLAIQNNQQLLNEIDDIFQSVTKKELEENQTLKDINQQYIFIYSNFALALGKKKNYESAIEANLYVFAIY